MVQSSRDKVLIAVASGEIPMAIFYLKDNRKLIIRFR
jgi:hypothetical protein